MRRRLPTLLLAACGLAATYGAAGAQIPSQKEPFPQAKTVVRDDSGPGSAPLPKVRHGTPESSVEAPPAPQPGLAAPAPPKAGAPPMGLRSQTLHQGDLKYAPDPTAFKRPQRDNRLRNADLARGSTNIAAAWFSGPTPRYRHTPFADNLHPTVVTVSTADQRVLRFELPKDSVFEDRTPRLVDLDGDGRDEVVVVRSYERKGSALAVLGVRDKGVEIIAETPPIGTPFHWLNPAGFADFDGDGRIDIALVTTPHGQGELQIWTLRGGALVLLADTDDVSNHAQGSRHQNLAAIADFNGDGVPDIAVPSRDRRRLRFLTMAKGQLIELGEARLAAPAAEDFELIKLGGRPAVRVGLAGGRTVIVSPCRDISDWEMAGDGC